MIWGDTVSLETEVVDTGTEGVEASDDFTMFDPDAQLIADLDTELNGGSDEVTESVGDTESENDSENSSETVYTVTVDGEQVEVSQSELLAGYSRQADYTKKTQALAAERQRLEGLEQLAQALNTNPQEALLVLAEQLGVDPSFVSKTPGSDAEDFGFDEDVDPFEREVREFMDSMKSQQVKQLQAEQDAQLEREIAHIRDANGAPDLDENVLLQFALDNRLGDLQAAYDLMVYRNSKTAGPDPAVEKLEAKRSAPPIQTGGPRNGTAAGGRISSIGDALRAALQSSDG